MPSLSMDGVCSTKKNGIKPKKLVKPILNGITTTHGLDAKKENVPCVVLLSQCQGKQAKRSIVPWPANAGITKLC